jgi:hypothetical protein
MPALVAGIHVFVPRRNDVDGRDKPGHDDGLLLCLNCRLKRSRGAGKHRSLL